MRMSHGRVPGRSSAQRTDNFTGQVHIDPALDAGDVQVLTVVFTPGARTFWHSHPGGQLLVVTGGRGVVANRSGESHIVGSGDLIWAEPGEQHWHGACADTLMTHTAASHGVTQWHGEVEDGDYAAPQRG